MILRRKRMDNFSNHQVKKIAHLLSTRLFGRLVFAETENARRDERHRTHDTQPALHTIDTECTTSKKNFSDTATR